MSKPMLWFLLASSILVGCAAEQKAYTGPRNLKSAIAALPPESVACKVEGVKRMGNPDPAEWVAVTQKVKRSGWVAVRYSMVGGQVVDAKVEASYPAGLYEEFAISHTKKNRNPAAPDASNCITTLEFTVS
ncbi:hypothetical protein [Paucibacter sp. KBW04]|uniref:hypothetical protein n=1 Tax=Paucibacter sp. KBW04 TaxID=2153361 RepID=UPI000F586255|nr:hypothetical protein [Paucibacter sp. KBW04]